MDTVEISEHLTRIGKDIMRIAENAEAAADHDIEGAQREAAIEQARAKLADYDAVIAKLALESKVQQAQFAKRFDFHVELIRESLEKVDAESGAGNDQ